MHEQKMYFGKVYAEVYIFQVNKCIIVLPSHQYFPLRINYYPNYEVDVYFEENGA